MLLTRLRPTCSHNSITPCSSDLQYIRSARGEVDKFLTQIASLRTDERVPLCQECDSYGPVSISVLLLPLRHAHPTSTNSSMLKEQVSSARSCIMISVVRILVECPSYVLFSPFGLRNHAAAENAPTTSTLISRAQLGDH